MVKIFADGACKGNPGPGGWAFIMIDSTGLVVERSGFEKETTNNRMEMRAILEALRSLPHSLPTPGTIECHLDSKYVLDGIQKWVPNWIQKGWLTSSRQAVKNKDLWQALWLEHQSLRPIWKHVKAHSGILLNERVDALASESALLQTTFLFEGPLHLHPLEALKKMQF
jgi:ribonuclease HI